MACLPAWRFRGRRRAGRFEPASSAPSTPGLRSPACSAALPLRPSSCNFAEVQTTQFLLRLRVGRKPAGRTRFPSLAPGLFSTNADYCCRFASPGTVPVPCFSAACLPAAAPSHPLPPSPTDTGFQSLDLSQRHLMTCCGRAGPSLRHRRKPGSHKPCSRQPNPPPPWVSDLLSPSSW